MNANRLYKGFEEDIYFTEDNKTVGECMLNEAPYYLAVNIIVIVNDEVVSKYYRNFDREVTFAYYQRFIKKFLTVKSYRKQYLAEGEDWEGVIGLFSKYGIEEAEGIS